MMMAHYYYYYFISHVQLLLEWKEFVIILLGCDIIIPARLGPTTNTTTCLYGTTVLLLEQVNWAWIFFFVIRRLAFDSTGSTHSLTRLTHSLDQTVMVIGWFAQLPLLFL